MLKAGRVFWIQDTVAVRRECRPGLRVVSARRIWIWASAPFRIPSGLAAEFQDGGGRRVLPASVLSMPQLAADAAAQRKLEPQRGICQDCSGGHNLLNPHIRRFSSGPHKLPLHLPLCHDVDTMSDCSPWTTLSNFNVPHYFSGARLRRSKRYRSSNWLEPFRWCLKMFEFFLCDPSSILLAVLH